MTRILQFYWIAISAFFIGLIYSSCVSNVVDENEKIARRYCGSCHHLPNPSSLTKDIWLNSIMPKMSDYFKWSERSDFHYANKPFYEQTGSIAMTDTIWSQILAFFENNAPQNPELIPHIDTEIQTAFQVIPVQDICSGRGITAVQIDSHKQSAYAACDSTYLEINDKGVILNKINTHGIISGIFPFGSDDLWILDPGVLDPHNASLGSIKRLNANSREIEILKDSLARPVYLNKSDNSIFISEFGNVTGSLSSLDISDAEYKRLVNLPGAYKSFVFDYDKDGNDEIIVMFAQALEGIYVREVEARTKRFVPLLSFGPEWGISDLDTADVNKDGWTDLIIANGDNADYSIIPKNYHGVRVYLNNREGRFDEKFCFAQHGTTQVQILDANGDSYPDILVGSFFALDGSNRLKLLIHKGDVENLNFTAQRFAESDQGRWMVMESNDLDGDGDQDAIVGSFEYIDLGTLYSREKLESKKTNLLLLLNQSIN